MLNKVRQSRQELSGAPSAWGVAGENVGELAVLVAAAGVCAFYFAAESIRPMVLLLFFIPVIISAFTLGRYRSCLIALLCLVFVVSCGQAEAPVALPALHTSVWAAILSLTAVLTGGLCDEKNSAIERLRQRSQEETFRDDLTQIANRRAFDYEIGRRASEHARYPEPMAMVLIDVDRFKQFNDRFGHPAGDAILRQLAAVLEKSVRAADLVARYGGEEFALLLPQTDPSEARLVAEKVRSAVESNWFEYKKSRYRITVSVGVSSMLDQDDVDQLTQRTDAALYTSKQSGRNCAHYHDGDVISPFGDRLPSQNADPQPTAQLESDQPTSFMDSESGLLRCDVFTHELTRRVAEVTRYGGAISVMLVKIVPPSDDLSEEALKLIRSVTAECIRNLLRTTDQGTQYRLTDFGIMLPCTELEDAIIPSLRLRSLVNECEKPIYQGHKLDFAVTVGVGKVTSDDKPGPLMTRLAQLADEAMHSPWGVVADQIDQPQIKQIAAELELSLPV